MSDKLEREQYIEKMMSHLPAFRALIDVTQERLAEILGIGRQTYMAIESGKTKLRWDTFVTLSVVFSFNEQTQSMAHMLGLDIDSVKGLLLLSSAESVGDKHFSNAQKLLNEYNTSMAAVYFELAGEQYVLENRQREAVEAYEKAAYCLDIDHDSHKDEVENIIAGLAKSIN